MILLSMDIKILATIFMELWLLQLVATCQLTMSVFALYTNSKFHHSQIANSP
jgi:hypothetical protein